MTGETSKAVFLSYASQDAEAAKRICESLRRAGVEVWFDQSELRGGDAWDAKIRKQIKECALFVPIISANTQARAEGYFRLEWHLAEQRSHLIARGRAFIVPIAIDDTGDAEALVPDAFLAVQWMRLSGGNASAEFCARIKSLLTGEPSRPRTSPPVAVTDSPSGAVRPPPLPSRRISWPLVLGGLALLLLAYCTFRPRRSPEEAAKLISSMVAVAEKVNAATDKPVPPVSEARKLADRANVILEGTSLTRPQLDAAGELCDRALQLDDTDPIVWATAAKADLTLIYPYAYDLSDQRRQRAMQRAARATSLAPDLFAVRVVQAAVYAHAVGTPALRAEAEKTLRELGAQHPGDKKLVLQLGEVLRDENHFDEAAKVYESIGEFEIAGWSYFQEGKLREALKAVEKSPRTVSALVLKATLQLDADEDPDEAQATIDQLKPSELLAEIPAANALRVALIRRDAPRMIELAQGLPQDFVDCNAFRGPRAYWIGLAHEIAGRPTQAESEWRSGLAVVETRLRSAPNDVFLLWWSAFLHASLKDTVEAERLLSRAQALAGLKDDETTGDSARVFLRLKKREACLAGLRRLFQAKLPGWQEAHVNSRFDILTDFLRGDPEFEKLMRDNLPAGAKPFRPEEFRPRG